MKLSKKDINEIRGALRQAFHRSEYYRAFLESKTYSKPRYKKDGTRHKVDNKCVICANCGGEYLRDSINIDHIERIGSFNNLDECQDFINKLYCDYSNLQVLCFGCHEEKTAKENTLARLNLD